MELKVKGHSGCQIKIVNDGNNLFIYKSTEDISYVDRLRKQAEKQLNAGKKIYQHIRVPEIYSIDGNKKLGKLTVKMEYVFNQNFVDYFEDAGFEQISYFIRALKIFINSEIESSPVKEVSTSLLIDKFNDIYHKVSANTLLNDDDDIKYIMQRSHECFRVLPSKITIPVGCCHGDLTLSNILFNGNNYYLIDFLDSFIESPIMDLVKIRQDTCYGWSQLMYKQKFDQIRLNIIQKKIDKAINDYYTIGEGKNDWYVTYYKEFQIMNFLRILQYAKEQKVVDYLKIVLKSML